MYQGVRLFLWCVRYGYLTVEGFYEMWKTKVLSIMRGEVKFEIETLNARYPVNVLLVHSPEMASSLFFAVVRRYFRF